MTKLLNTSYISPRKNTLNAFEEKNQFHFMLTLSFPKQMTPLQAMRAVMTFLESVRTSALII